MPTQRVALLLELAGFDWNRCPQCGEDAMKLVERLPRQKALFSPNTTVREAELPAADTS